MPALITQNSQVANVIANSSLGAGIVNNTGDLIYYIPSNSNFTTTTGFPIYPTTGTVQTVTTNWTSGGFWLPSTGATTSTIITAYASSGTTYFTSNGNGIQSHHGCALVNYSPEDIDRLARAEKARLRSRSAAIHRAKGSIKRAMQLIDNVGFGNDVRVFLAGDEIEISHPDSLFKFVLSKGGYDLIDRTISPGHSTPYKLQLYTKTDVHVANLCVVNDSPVLDQILSVCLFIKSGEEDEVLSKANWSSLTYDPDVALELAASSPMISKKLRLERFN